MHPGGFSGRRCALQAAALFLCVSIAAAASAAGLSFETVLRSPIDLDRVIERADGGFGLLRGGRIEVVQPDRSIALLREREEGQTLVLSDGGSWIGAATHRPGAADFAPTAVFRLLDAGGEPVWEIGPTEDVAYAISRAGAVVGMSLNVNVPDRNRLRFYGEGGRLAAEVAVEGLAGGRFDAEGELFVAASTTEGLRAFDPLGTEIWRLPGARLFDVAPGGRFAAAIAGDALVSVRDGGISGRVPLDRLLVRRVAIAPDGSRIAVAGKHEIRVYEGEDLAPAFRIPVERDRFAVTSIDLGAAGGWIAVGVARDLGRGVPIEDRHPSGEVRFYDAGGRMIHSGRMEFPIWNIWTPTVVLDSGGKSAVVTTRRSVYRVALP